MKNTVFFSLVLLISMAIYACEEEDDFVEDDPTIEVVFYNMDSLVQVEYILDSVSDSLDILTDTLIYFSDSADIVSDSVLIVSATSVDGNLDELEAALQEELERLNVLYDEFEEDDSVMSASEDYWTAVETAINNGEVVISRITNKINLESITYDQETDTASAWNIPLDMNADMTSIELKLGDEVFELNVEYSRFISANEFGEVSFTAFGFSEDNITSTFDSLELDCNTTKCLDSEASISVYF